MQTVKVRLRKPNRVLTFVAKNVPLVRNDACVVKSDRGMEFGSCVIPPQDCANEEADRFKMNVIRKATHHDMVTYGQLTDDETRAKKMCAERVRERKLPMKLVDVEYTFDRRKVTFFFTADDRVDFRELVRDLAKELKTRIELRHIQVRDAAKMVGGIGTCGRELCCTSWMQEFMPISMKMAKRQNLSLNPSKISGQCGRLMCCLSYENEVYKTMRAEERPDPRDLAGIRDEMEEHQGATVSKLKRTSLRDVLDEDEEDSFENAAPLVEVHMRHPEPSSRSRQRDEGEATPRAETLPIERTRGPVPATAPEAYEEEEFADEPMAPEDGGTESLALDEDTEDRAGAPPSEPTQPGDDPGGDRLKRRRRGKRGGKGRR